MKLLIDTHAFLWLLADDARLSRRARTTFASTSTELFFSVASVWELAIKKSLGKLELLGSLREIFPAELERQSIRLMSIDPTHALRCADLPWHHRDPFDRMLVAQSIEERISLLSADAALDAYGVKRVW